MRCIVKVVDGMVVSEMERRPYQAKLGSQLELPGMPAPWRNLPHQDSVCLWLATAFPWGCP